MVSVHSSKTVWIKRQQCPCGNWKCFATREIDTDETNTEAQSIKTNLDPLETMITPYVGMVFKTDDEAFRYYSHFARKNGFSIRKERSRLSPQLGVYKQDFVCYRSGFAPACKKQKGEHHQRDRKSVRCGCDARMYLSKEVVDGVSQWLVVQFSNIPNHELLEDNQVRLLPAYRKIHETDQECIILLSKAGFPIHRIVKVLELEKGIQGGQLSFLERDVRNFIQNRKRVIQENDALLTKKRENEMVDFLNACRANQEADPSFVYDFAVDENDRVENVAWCFGDSVNAYDLFGDVVYLDSMYHSLSYGMRIGAWLGINSHGKIILFGCALLQDENPLSFAWALQAFLRFMKERYPQTIITDVDPCLVEAIRSEFPNTKHFISLYSNILPRLSTWFSVPLGPRFIQFKYDFEEICCLESIAEFEYRWNQMVSHFGINSVGLQQSNDEEPQYMHLKTCLPIEEHARSVLTPFAFDGMQQEMVLALQYATSEMANGSYLVTHFKKVDREHLVVWIPGDEQIHCSCKEFESTGILCRHALRVLLLKNYFQLPSKYILDRWRQESSIFGFNEHSNLQNKDEWYREFDSLTGTLFSEVMLTKERSDFVRRELKKEITRLVEQVRDMPAVDDVVMDVSLSPAEL